MSSIQTKENKQQSSTIPIVKEGNHRYYCNESSWSEHGAAMDYNTINDFLSVWGVDPDFDYNLIFRWDIKPKNETDGYYAEVFVIQQRKGRFVPIRIKNVKSEELPEFEKFLQAAYNHLQSLWAPFSCSNN